MQSSTQTALNIKSNFEISPAVFAIKSFFLKNFPSEINVISKLRDFTHATVSISPEQTVLLLKALFDKRRDGERLDITAENDDFSFCLTVKASSLRALSDNETSQLREMAQRAGFTFEIGEELIFRIDVAEPSQYLVFVRSISVIENILSLVFEK